MIRLFRGVGLRDSRFALFKIKGANMNILTRSRLRFLVVRGKRRCEFLCTCGRMHEAGWGAWHRLDDGSKRIVDPEKQAEAQRRMDEAFPGIPS